MEYELNLELLLKRRVVAYGALGQLAVGAKSARACEKQLAELRKAFTRLPLSDATAQEASDWALTISGRRPPSQRQNARQSS